MKRCATCLRQHSVRKKRQRNLTKKVVSVVVGLSHETQPTIIDTSVKMRLLLLFITNTILEQKN